MFMRGYGYAYESMGYGSGGEKRVRDQNIHLKEED
jgi:hypothetical protein